MYVTSVKVDDAVFCPSLAVLSGRITYLTDEGSVVLVASIAFPSDYADTDAQYVALVADAVRQLGRMPLYRTGLKRVQFANGVLSPALQSILR